MDLAGFVATTTEIPAFLDPHVNDSPLAKVADRRAPAVGARGCGKLGRAVEKRGWAEFQYLGPVSWVCFYSFIFYSFFIFLYFQIQTPFKFKFSFSWKTYPQFYIMP